MTTKERIFEVATEKFSEKGYNIATMRDISGAVGITEGALYRHYESKEEILEDILDTFGRRHELRLMSEREIEAAVETQAPGEILARFVSYLFDDAGPFMQDALRIISRESQTYLAANNLLNRMYSRLYALAKYLLDLLVRRGAIPETDTYAFALSLSQLMVSTAQRWAACYRDSEEADRVLSDYRSMCGLMTGLAVNGGNIAAGGERVGIQLFPIMGKS